MHLDLSEMLSTTEVQRENNIVWQANKQKQTNNKKMTQHFNLHFRVNSLFHQAIKRVNQNSSFY